MARQICEDIPAQLDHEIPGLDQKPSAMLVPQVRG